MKTAMQQHLEWLKARMTVTPQMEKELLDQEKQQIIDCHIEGQKSMNYGMNSFKHLAKSYYKETFKQD